jgi:uncharacterized protein
MPNPVVHFEITGRDPERLRAYYAALFGWEYQLPSPAPVEISDEGQYGFVEASPIADGTMGIRGGIGGGPTHEGHVVFYVGVDDVEAALAEAERLGGSRVFGPVLNPTGMLVVGHFVDPEGHLIGVAGPPLR